MKNQDIFHAMTIKLEACDIPKEIPKMDPGIRRAPKRVVALTEDDIKLALKMLYVIFRKSFMKCWLPNFWKN